MLKKILIIQTAFIGDCILILPAIQLFKAKFPEIKIDVLTTHVSAEIFINSPSVNSVIIYDKRNKEKGIAGIFRLASKLRLQNYDKLFSFHKSFRTGLLVLLSGIKETVGYKTSSLSFLYKDKVEYLKKEHETIRTTFLLIGEKTNIKEIPPPEIKLNGNSKEKIDVLLNDLQNLIAIAPGSVWATKRYPVEYYIQVAEELIKDGYTVILIGGKNDIELCNLISEQNNRIINTCGKFSIVESVYLISKCKLLITNDSAPTHFGMAALTKTLTIYCSTVPEFGFYPYSENSRYIGLSDINCKPCGIHGFNKCPKGHFECGKKLQPKKIIDKVIEML